MRRINTSKRQGRIPARVMYTQPRALHVLGGESFLTSLHEHFLVPTVLYVFRCTVLPLGEMLTNYVS